MLRQLTQAMFAATALDPASSITVRITDADGRYVLPLPDEATIFVVKPAGYMPPVDPVPQSPRFYRLHQPKGSPAELKTQTGSETLEQAFLALTGSSIRDEEASSLDRMRNMSRLWRRR